MLPFTPITEAYLESPWVEEEYPILATRLDEMEEGWRGFAFMDHAVIDKNAAWTEVNTLKTFDDGNSKTNTLYWVATRP